MPPEKDESKMPATSPARRARIVQFVVAMTCISILGFAVIPRLRLHRKLALQQDERLSDIPNVFVMEAKQSPPEVTVQLSGTMSPITEAPLLARVDGYLKKRSVDIGDHVRAGQVLAIIAAPDVDQQVAQAAALANQSKSNLRESMSTLDQAKANAGIAKITADRWAALVQKGAVSRQANDNYQFAYSAQTAAVGVAAASVAAANNNVGASSANLAHYRELQGFEMVKAPFDGVITERNVDTGALITATTTLLFRIAKNDTLRTFIDVPQVTASSIRIGDEAKLVFVQYPSRTFRGRVTRTADNLNLNTRTLLTEVDVDNKDGSLLPGMYATVTFDLPRTVSSVFIPGEAMLFRADGTSVAVVDNGIVHIRKVNVGHDYGASLEILSGLRVGDRIVVNPNDITVEGARVAPVLVNQASASLNATEPSKSKY